MRDAAPGVLSLAVAEQVARINRAEVPATGNAPRLRFIEPHRLHGLPITQREWIVADWLPCGSATLLFGDGGTGKTLLAQQLMTSCATGRPWIGLAVTPCRSLAVFCEDDEAELQRRQDRINQAYGIDFDDLDDMTWASGVGQDNCLMRFSPDGRPQRTERWTEIRDAAIAHQARLVVIDTAADTFSGNENDRSQVRSFMGSLNALAMEIGGAVLVNAHPSRTGLSATGDMDGGSTAWSNTARSRWSLARPKAEGDEQADADERVLCKRKANYASVGDVERLRWSGGVLAPVTRVAGFAAVSAQADADAIFVALLSRHHASGIRLSQSNRGANYAPKLFAKAPDRGGLTARELELAMGRLLAAGTIRVHDFGRANRPERALVVAAEVQNDPT